jgi:hypothetical protein
MTWVTGLALVGGVILLCFVWDLAVCGGKRCAQLVDHFVLFPRVRARRRARGALCGRRTSMLDRIRKLPEGLQGLAIAGTLGLILFGVALLIKLIA